ncbi:hypothetical protein RFI_22893 [Reticulomyxa filosa]|uniref:Uncharacterized protein n=1 Tax=Reticulomyxa filosa TaxID=46433 RepID=X6MN16_RETFI|nr:hypothetical protein RFI_22893 [Reticulomyxa filosa]|eukprot:ETO14475.1 hypothetical protein RFI_22893 [Reticulomyxa filosa]
MFEPSIKSSPGENPGSPSRHHVNAPANSLKTGSNNPALCALDYEMLECDDIFQINFFGNENALRHNTMHDHHSMNLSNIVGHSASMLCNNGNGINDSNLFIDFSDTDNYLASPSFLHLGSPNLFAFHPSNDSNNSNGNAMKPNVITNAGSGMIIDDNIISLANPEDDINIETLCDNPFILPTLSHQMRYFSSPNQF